jgi:hypothetical protein
MYASSDGYEPCDRCDVGQKSSKQSGSTTCIPESQAGGCGGSDDDPSTGRSEVNNCQSIKNDQTTCDDSYQVVNGKNEDCAYCVAKGLPSGDAVYCINSGSTTHYIQQTEMLGATMTCTLNSDTDDAGQGPLSDDAEPTKAPTSAPNGNGKVTITDCRVYSELSDAGMCNNAQVGNSTSTIKPCTFCTGSAMGQKRYFCLDSSLTGFYSEQFKAKGGTLTCAADQDKCRANEEKEDPEDASSKCVCVSLYRRDPATKKCVEAPTCPIGYYSSTGFTPCYRCEDGKTSSASQGGFTRCFTPGDNSGGNGVPDDVQDRTLVADCRKYYENPTQCDKSYMTVAAGHNEDCSYCTFLLFCSMSSLLFVVFTLELLLPACILRHHMT